MEFKIVLSALSLTATIIYLYVGFYTWFKQKKLAMHKGFLALCLSFAIWSFAYAFAYLAKNDHVFYIWNKISAVGWCSFSALTLHLTLLITENKVLRHKAIQYILYIPAIIFFILAVFFFGENIQTPAIIAAFFYIGDFIYNFTYLILSMVALMMWGKKSKSKLVKRQSKYLLLASGLSFLLNLFTQTLLPVLFSIKPPLMGQLYALILIAMTYIVITKYKFMNLLDHIILDEIAKQMIDMVLVLNPDNEVLKITSQTSNLLGYDENEATGKPIDSFFNGFHLSEQVLDTDKNIKFNDIEIVRKDGSLLPVNISFIPVFESNVHEYLGAVLVIQDISLIYELKRKNVELKERAIRDSLTNLYNHQYSVERINLEIEKVRKGETKVLSIMMMDLDYFKNINDNYGHIFGDYVLKALADLLVNLIREYGFIGRFGGEEFVVVLPEINMEKAKIIAETVRSQIAAYPFRQGATITASIGVITCKGECMHEPLAQCDDLLYKAKRNGRNRIEY